MDEEEIMMIPYGTKIHKILQKLGIYGKKEVYFTCFGPCRSELKELSNGNINGQSIKDIVDNALSTSETTSEEIKEGSSEKASKV